MRLRADWGVDMNPGTIQHTVLCFVQKNPGSTPDGVAKGAGLMRAQTSNALRTMWLRGHLTRHCNTFRQFEYTAKSEPGMMSSSSERHGYVGAL